MCNTIHIKVGDVIKDPLGNDYQVVAMSVNEWLQVISTDSQDPFVGNTFMPPSVLFLHGTPSSTNNEYLKLHGTRTLEKTPFIWLLLPYTENYLPLDSSLVASYNARIFFMDWANVDKWKNDQHNDLAIKPMNSLCSAFINVIENDYSFKNLVEYTRQPRPRFGVEVTNKGSEKTIIHENLSGIDLTLLIELYSTSKCCNK
jgi:hypothetical protein